MRSLVGFALICLVARAALMCSDGGGDMPVAFARGLVVKRWATVRLEVHASRLRLRGGGGKRAQKRLKGVEGEAFGVSKGRDGSSGSVEELSESEEARRAPRKGGVKRGFVDEEEPVWNEEEEAAMAEKAARQLEAGEEDDDDEEEGDAGDASDSQGHDYIRTEGHDNTLTGLEEAQADMDRAVEELDRARANMPKELELDTLRQKAKSDPVEQEDIPDEFLEQLEALEEDGGGGGGGGGAGGESGEESGESREGSEDVEVDEVNAESFGMKFLANEKERVGKAKAELLTAAQSGDDDGVRRAVRRGAPVNAADPNMAGWTALHYASEVGSLDAVRILLSLGANASAESHFKTTPLHTAAQHEQEDIVEELIANGSSVHARNDAGYTPLLMAAGRSKVTVVRLLHRAGGRLEDTTYCGNNALHLAATNGHEHMVCGVLGLGVPVNGRNDEGYTALHHAALMDRHVAVQRLLENGADPGIQNAEGQTALHCAAKQGKLSALENLATKALERDVLFVMDCENKTALEHARTMGEGLCASLLWERMGRPGGKLDVLPKPKTKLEEDQEYLRELWQTYKAHRNESFFGGISPADDIGVFMRAKRRMHGEEERVLKEEDMFVIRKGVREYVMDKPEQRKMLLDREYRKEMKPLGNIGR